MGPIYFLIGGFSIWHAVRDFPLPSQNAFIVRVCFYGGHEVNKQDFLAIQATIFGNRTVSSKTHEIKTAQPKLMILESFSSTLIKLSDHADLKESQ